jgi:hypothetical protein
VSKRHIVAGQQETYLIVYEAERKKRVAPEGEGASSLAGGGCSVHATRAKYASRLPQTSSSCIDFYQK